MYHQLAAGRKEAHPDADVCTDPGCCSAWLSEEAAQEKWGDDFTAWEERIEDAVAATDGQVALYRGEPILAVLQNLAKSINCRNDVGLISVAHQATTFLLRSRIRFTQCQWIELYPFVITHP